MHHVFTSLFPSLTNLDVACVSYYVAFQEVGPKLIADIAQFMVKSGLGTAPDDVSDWVEYVKAKMFKPEA